jgi:tungstate transport system substrate-binding protein
LRRLRGAAGGATVVAPAAASQAPRVLGRPRDPKLVRLSSVVTPQDGGLYGLLLPDFTRQTGYNVELTTAQAVYQPARTGRADVVLSHYGHHDLQPFAADGLGAWPQVVFSNQLALIGPPDDPAKISGETSLVAAFTRLAAGKHAYVVNDSEGVKYLSELLWEAAGRPAKTGWYVDPGAQGAAALSAATERRAYVIWGLTPFLRTQRGASGTGGGGAGAGGGGGGGGAGGAAGAAAAFVPVLLGDPLLQRIMVTVAVRADKVANVNVAGVKAFQEYLLAPRTQAMIHAFRLPGIPEQIWWPAGRHNSGEVLHIGAG